MRDGLVVEGFGRPAPVGSSPWAFALNRRAIADEVEISLLTFTAVGGVVRVSGLVRSRRPDLRLSRVPDLAVQPLDGPQLTQIGAHVLPHGDLTWVSWVFERPATVLVAYEGRIERLDLAYRSGRRSEVASNGPWVFRFRLECPSRRREALGGRLGREGP